MGGSPCGAHQKSAQPCAQSLAPSPPRVDQSQALRARLCLATRVSTLLYCWPIVFFQESLLELFIYHERPVRLLENLVLVTQVSQTRAAAVCGRLPALSEELQQAACIEPCSNLGTRSSVADLARPLATRWVDGPWCMRMACRLTNAYNDVSGFCHCCDEPCHQQVGHACPRQAWGMYQAPARLLAAPLEEWGLTAQLLSLPPSNRPISPWAALLCPRNEGMDAQRLGRPCQTFPAST
jgi:hypothetical protein